jgi:RimJ/RimL family protein N-acetyltransferase
LISQSRGLGDVYKRQGFTQEGVLREAFEDGEDAILYGMLKSECKWIRS